MQLAGYAVIYDSHSEVIGEVIDGRKISFVERIMPGAFTESIEGGKIEFRDFNHGDVALGNTETGNLRVYEDSKGIFFCLDCSYIAKTHRSLFNKVASGAVSGVSIRFRFLPEEAQWDREAGIKVRSIHKAKLLHISPVERASYSAPYINAVTTER